MIHLLNKSSTPKDATILLNKARELVEPRVVVRDIRVSRKYIEIDTSIPENMNMNELIDKLGTISPLANYERIVECHMEKNEAIKLAIKLFNDEKYWSAHEALEPIWKSASGDEKSVLNGIILVAAAFVHDEKDEKEICLSILQRALKKIEGANGMYHEVDLTRIKDLVSEIVGSGKIERFTI